MSKTHKVTSEIMYHGGTRVTILQTYTPKNKRIPRRLKKQVRNILKGRKLNKNHETVISRVLKFTLKDAFENWVLKLDSPGGIAP